MFDPNVGSVTCSGLDIFDCAVDFNDLMFLNLVSVMAETDAALAAQMKAIRELNNQKRELMRKIQNLKDAVAKSNARQDCQDVEVYGSLENPEEVPGTGPSIGKQHGKETHSLMDVNNQIEKFQSQLDELNTSSEVMLIDLQRLLNKRNEAVQLVSNIEAKSHQTAQAIISNFK